ncbi:MAG: Methionyl-tRNA formyltransferase [Bacteroidetes bacterium ADurb.BinA174]|nr:MAG: Methionyl-tRNA formyltransferase [Bacteroidetes bacterium ADurb.BinA174]
MKKEDLRIVFMGTPDFAVESLKALVENNYNIVGVITAPDKPAGRGYKLQPSAVKEYALSKGLHILQPENLKNEVFLTELKQLEADIQVVVAFRMLPETVWNMPPKGTFNLHASLLPQYRGAAPINWAIINGEKETGVTTFFLKHEIDTGEIIFQEKIVIEDNDNAETIYDKLMILGSQLVLKTIDAVINGDIQSQPQSFFIKNENDLKLAPKIFKETGEINWNKPAREIHNLVRGLSPYPAAWTEFEVNGEKLNFKIFETKINNEKHQQSPGEIITDNKTTLQVAVQDGFIEILDIQLSGKKRMKIKDFLNGFSFLLFPTLSIREGSNCD